MTAVVQAAPSTRPITIRPAPPREPPFDDELPVAVAQPGRYDLRLPFELPPRVRPWQPPPRPPNGLPNPAPWGRQLLVGMIETAAGRRPLHQLASLLSPSVGRGLCADFEHAAQSGTPHWLNRARVRLVRASEPAPGIAELCATVETGRRVRAIAMRLEERRGRWCCTRLQLG